MRGKGCTSSSVRSFIGESAVAYGGGLEGLDISGSPGSAGSCTVIGSLRRRSMDETGVSLSPNWTVIGRLSILLMSFLYLTDPQRLVVFLYPGTPRTNPPLGFVPGPLGHPPRFPVRGEVGKICFSKEL